MLQEEVIFQQYFCTAKTFAGLLNPRFCHLTLNKPFVMKLFNTNSIETVNISLSDV